MRKLVIGIALALFVVAGLLAFASATPSAGDPAGTVVKTKKAKKHVKRHKKAKKAKKHHKYVKKHKKAKKHHKHVKKGSKKLVKKPIKR